jgi:hypothetical protein
METRDYAEYANGAGDHAGRWTFLNFEDREPGASP